MHAMHLVQIVTGVAATSAAITWYFARDRRNRRAIVATPVVKVGSVQEGQTVRITGRLQHGPSTLEAPFSGRTCAHYDALLEERSLDAGKEVWSILARETASRPFFIDDGTGRARIDTTRFEGIIDRDRQKTMGPLDREKALAFLSKHGHAAEMPPGRVLRYREGVLEANERVTVLGTARFETHDGEKFVVIGASEGASVRASDDPTLTVTMRPPGTA